MGEVGTNSGDGPHVDLKMNGNMNGSCEEDEPMEVDTSQENSSSASSDVTAKKNSIESNVNGKAKDAKATNADPDTTDSTTTNNNSESKLDGSSDEKSSNGDGEDAKSEENSENESPTNGKEDVEEVPVQEYSNSKKGDVDGVNEPAIAAAKNSESDGDTVMLNSSAETVEQEKDDGDPLGMTTDVLEHSRSDKKRTETNQDNAKTTNGALNDSQSVEIASSIVDDDEVHAISDSDDDEPKQSSAPVRPMAVSNANSNEMTSNGVKGSNAANCDDEKPVSIHSDSDSEMEMENSNKNVVHEILSDNEDCVVIGDDQKFDENDVMQRKNNRARKSAVRPRDFTDYDDDIEEIHDDPLEAPMIKKPRLNLPNNLPQSLTIQDARTLTGNDPMGLVNSFQQKFNQSLGGAGNKEPTLVIIDTNSILNRGTSSTVQALQKQNVSVLPVGVPAQGVYPLNMQASITPVPNSNQTNFGAAKTTTAPTPVAAPGLTLINAPVLTSLTDDMFVLEAPSFIVPYIYEKPPATELKEIVEKIRVELEEQRKKEEKEEAAESDGNDTKEKENTVEPEEKKVPKKKKKPTKSADDSWDESDTSTDDEASDTEERTKVLIKEAKTDLDTIKPIIGERDPLSGGVASSVAGVADDKKDNNNYFESPLGKFFMDIGINLVQEHVQTDLLRQQKRKLNREGNQASPSVQVAINSLMKNLELSKGKNDVFKFETKRCEYCNFKSESSLVMAHHYETPHMKGNLYKCNFCSYEVRPPYDILFHMKTEHNIQARLEKAASYHQCPNCLFEDNGKSKLARHALVCIKKFRPEVNLCPPTDWEPPAKIPRIKPRHGLVGTANAYQAMAAQAQRAATAAALQRQNAANATAAMRNRGRPQNIAKTVPIVNNVRTNQQNIRPQMAGGMVLPNNFQLTNAGQFIQVPGTGMALLPNVSNVPNTFNLMQSSGSKTSKTSQQPSISITALPRQNQSLPSSTTNMSASVLQQAAGIIPKPPGIGNMKPGQSPQAGSKASFVICEICDGYIKDLDQLRNHMQWMHKVKIHPKMIYNRPPLNCQKCQFRFFTDQGLERHLLGSHGLVTSSMQEAANKGKDAGRCPVCGRMYQWKLLNHVSREHNMTLKPAHLSYKCTVCTATFGMYKQFENHVYSAHSTVAKKSVDSSKKSSNSSSSSSVLSGRSIGGSGLTVTSSNAGDSLLKPLKINDEITIIPQPASRNNRSIEIESHVID